MGLKGMHAELGYPTAPDGLPTGSSCTFIAQQALHCCLHNPTHQQLQISLFGPGPTSPATQPHTHCWQDCDVLDQRPVSLQQAEGAPGIAFGSKPAEAAAAAKPEGQENISGASNGTAVQVRWLLWFVNT